MRRHLCRAFGAALWLMGPSCLGAVTIGQVAQGSFQEQLGALMRLEDVTLRTALLGFTLLGLQSGLLGSFMLVRRMAMVGDTLAHAVLPGIVLGFCWNLSKDPVPILVGAGLMAWLGMSTVEAIKRHTPLKADAALALMLSGCYGFGAFLISCLQKHPLGAKAGLDRLLFGQAAALGTQDLWLMASGLVALLLLLGLCYKELLTTSFDPVFAQSLGLHLHWVNKALMGILGFTLIVALQAVGAILLSALFILPAATAYLLTRSFKKLLLLAMGLAVCSGWLGTIGSFMVPKMPTGPCVVLVAGVFFFIVFTLSPLHGWLPQWQRHRKQHLKATRENTLKQLYNFLQARNDQGLPIQSLAHHLGLTPRKAQRLVRPLIRRQLLMVLNPDAPWVERFVQLSPEGLQAARSIIRKHRLWELYLTHQAAIAPDHVHDDAETIEHVLGESLVRDLDRSLNFPSHDPHGQKIPTA